MDDWIASSLRMQDTSYEAPPESSKQFLTEALPTLSKTEFVSKS
jgi:hypothetical protein